MSSFEFCGDQLTLIKGAVANDREVLVNWCACFSKRLSEIFTEIDDFAQLKKNYNQETLLQVKALMAEVKALKFYLNKSIKVHGRNSCSDIDVALHELERDTRKTFSECVEKSSLVYGFFDGDDKSE